jgi:acyl transferase domain-containing protein
MTDVIGLLQRAKLELEDRRRQIERLQAALDGQRRPVDRRIAVIGAGIRLPGSISTEDELWRSLLASEVHARAISAHRSYAITDLWRRAEAYTSRMALIEDPSGFDHHFFRISPRELRHIDPQHRLLLEMAWEALENAAIPPVAGPGTCGGVFIGISSDDFQRLGRAACVADGLEAYAGTGAHRSMAAGRLAAFLNWNGPAIQVDTACSSSLVAIHLACQALHNGDIGIALAGGCHLILDPASVVERGVLGALARDGLCKPFEDVADGFGMGEGGALVVLRTYEAAVRDCDPIIGVIDGISVNHNGAGAGVTVPNPSAQVAVMSAALRDAGANPDEVVFLEAHGTGTKLGDPIEASAIETVYGARQDKFPLGSIKANFGHLEAAAGVVSLLKALLVLRHGIVPSTPSCNRDSGYIPWADMAAYVPRRTQTLARHSQDVRVAVSSFGMSGTNCHVILSAAPTTVDGPRAVASALPILISAADPRALAATADRLARQVQTSSIELADIAQTLATGRAHFEYRVGFVATSRSDLLSGLCEIAEGTTPRDGFAGRILSGRQARFKIVLDEQFMDHTGERLLAILAALLTGSVRLRMKSRQASAESNISELTARAVFEEFWHQLIPSYRENTLGTGISAESGSGAQRSDEVEKPINVTAMFDKTQTKGRDDALESVVQFAVAHSLAALFCVNAAVEWKTLCYSKGRRVPLASYPFQRRVPNAPDPEGVR